MRTLRISPATQEKLKEKHGVTLREVEQCFENVVGTYVEDTREDHKTNPPSLWFIAPTNELRRLKVIFIFIDGNIHIKSAFEPDQASVDLYERLGR